jgi:hypothetical protein
MFNDTDTRVFEGGASIDVGSYSRGCSWSIALGFKQIEGDMALSRVRVAMSLCISSQCGS